jgi:hypothetical protein
MLNSSSEGPAARNKTGAETAPSLATRTVPNVRESVAVAKSVRTDKFSNRAVA